MKKSVSRTVAMALAACMTVGSLRQQQFQFPR